MVRRCNDREAGIRAGLTQYQAVHGPLMGIQQQAHLDTLVRQMIASLRRTEYINVMKIRLHSPHRSDPNNPLFDPLVAAHLLSRAGRQDEAIWMVFLATQFGKHIKDGWKLCANIYGSFGIGPVWSAAEYRRNRPAFAAMLVRNAQNLADPAIAGRYSNHRQYVSRRPNSIERTFAEMYNWIFEENSFDDKVRRIHREMGQDPEVVFNKLYGSVRKIYSFGRLGAFDFLTMLGKIGLSPISPGSAYLVGATGPLNGARLLFHGTTNHPVTAYQLSRDFDRLDDYINIGKQPLEDSVCNWQKSPGRFKQFHG